MLSKTSTIALILLLSSEWVMALCVEPTFTKPCLGGDGTTKDESATFERIYSTDGLLCAEVKLGETRKTEPFEILAVVAEVTYFDVNGEPYLRESYGYGKSKDTEKLMISVFDANGSPIWRLALDAISDLNGVEYGRPYYLDTFISNIPLEDDTLRERAFQLGR